MSPPAVPDRTSGPSAACPAHGVGPAAPPTPSLTATVLLVSSLTVLANATIAPALPGLARAFAGTPGIETLAGLVLSLPALAVVLCATAFGWAADRFERRVVLMLALLVYGLGGASGVLAETMPQILAGRLLLGAGVAGTLTVATQLAADHWHGADRARFMGWQGAAISATGIASLVTGGALAELSWRAPFAIYLLALPAGVVAWSVVPARRGRSAVASLVPSAPREPFPWRVLALTGGILFLAMVFILLVATRLPFLLGEIGVVSPGVIGVTLALMTVASFPTGLFYGRVRARLGPPMIAAIALALMGTGFAIVSGSHALGFVTFGILVTGAGVGLIIPNQNVWLMAHVPEAARGRASGLMTACLFAGQFVSPIVSGALLAAMDLSAVFLAFGLAIGAVALALLIAGRRPRMRSGEP